MSLGTPGQNKIVHEHAHPITFTAHAVQNLQHSKIEFASTLFQHAKTTPAQTFISSLSIENG